MTQPPSSPLNSDPSPEAVDGDGAAALPPASPATAPEGLVTPAPETPPIAANGRLPRPADDDNTEVKDARLQPDPAISGAVANSGSAVTVVAVAVILIGLTIGSVWLTLAGSLVATIVSLRLMGPFFLEVVAEMSPQQQSLLIGIPGMVVGLVGLLQITGVNQAVITWGLTLRWDVLGALGDFLGALGQIFIAFLALFVAWRQYIISRDLTVQQNRITQQQTIDAFFQGISELVLDDEGLLEDWPQERIIAEARTAAILSSVDAPGKAKVIRFLSRSKLLTPLRRDNRLGRPILDGVGGYEEDRAQGTRVIDLGAMLAATDLANSDLRWTDLSEANLIRCRMQGADLVKANLARTILYEADLSGADMMGARLFYGDVETASPRTRSGRPNYQTGEYTGAVVEGVAFTGAKRLSEDQRRYCCAWGGSATRSTVPGGCEDVPNRLGR